jgi:hypothetical protein
MPAAKLLDQRQSGRLLSAAELRRLNLSPHPAVERVPRRPEDEHFLRKALPDLAATVRCSRGRDEGHQGMLLCRYSERAQATDDARVMPT